LSRKVDDLAATIKAYRARLAELDRQAGFVTSLQAQLAEELAGHQRR
jgi:prefoldin subunit 5